MKYTLFFCSLFFLAAASLLRAAPEITEVRDLNPPIQWQTDKSLANEPWWPALMASLDPGQFTFAQWQQYFSDAARQAQ